MLFGFKAIYGYFCIKLVFILPKTKTHGIDYSEVFIGDKIVNFSPSVPTGPTVIRITT